MAARIRRELQTDLDMVRGRYAEFKVLVVGKVVGGDGTAAFLGVLPSARKILATVREQSTSGGEISTHGDAHG